MLTFLVASLISLTLIIVCVVLFYEIMVHVWGLLPRLEGRPLTQSLFTILAAFVGHTLVIWIFSLTYYGFANHFGFGDLAGTTGHGLLDYVYFASEVYSSLGLGDVYPTGGMKLLVAVETILGLILIGWTITFTYLLMEKYLAHRHKRHGSAKD